MWTRHSAMSEQSRQPSGVQENSAIFALDAPAGDVRDQAGQSTCCIGGVEEDAPGAGGQPHYFPRGRSQRGIAGADLAVVELQVRAPHPDVRHAVEKLAEPGIRVGDGTSVDADDPFGTKPGDQSGHGRAGSERDDDMVKARQLGEQLAAAVHIALRGKGARARPVDRCAGRRA
jgi:hypothetical protein